MSHVLVFAVFIAFLPCSLAHGALTTPEARDFIVPGGTSELKQNNPINFPDNPSQGWNHPDFKCRGHPAGEPVLELQTGSDVSLTWTFTVAHVGDCSLYLSYDGGELWFKIWNGFDCKEQNNQVVDVAIPDWLPSCDEGCVMRWEWVALHQYPETEMYSQCVDVTISRAASGPGEIPAAEDTYAIPGHLPDPSQTPSPYRDPFPPSLDTTIAGPAVVEDPQGSGQSGGAAGDGDAATSLSSILMAMHQ